jgi:hypothetical protein
MPKSDPKRLEEIERIQAMPYERQLRWASKLDPWEGLNMPDTRILRKDVNEIDGNVMRMPNLGGRPCFGNPVAWIVHGVVPSRWAIVRGARTIVQTRCGSCKAREGCGKVAEARLVATPEIAKAAGEFRSAGGRDALASQRSQTARAALGRLLQALDAHGAFTNVNDEYARNWPAAERQRIRDGAAIRKRAQRARDVAASLRNHEIHPLLADHLPREAHLRRLRYAAFRDSGSAPPQITIDPTGENQRFTADVWLVRERLTLQGKAATAYGVAKEMINADLSYGLSHEVLRGRVGAALRRINLLEAARMPGTHEIVWPTFNAEDTLNELLDLADLTEA